MKSPKPLQPFTIVTRKRSGDSLTNTHRLIESPNLQGARASGRAMAQLFDEYYIITKPGHILV